MKYLKMDSKDQIFMFEVKTPLIHRLKYRIFVLVS